MHIKKCNVYLLAWWLLVDADHFLPVLGHNTSALLLPELEVNQPCVVLSQHGLVLPWCNSHQLPQTPNVDQVPFRCSASSANINFVPAEIKPGFRLVGSHSGDKFSCHPLSDEDFWRSRKAVHIIRALSLDYCRANQTHESCYFLTGTR